MGSLSANTPQPGWKRLWRHSYRLGFSWFLRTARSGWQPGRKAGFQRLLVPLDPWRYYEMGALAEEHFSGRCLDVSSPKLITSLLQHEGSGEWLGIDLFAEEIEAWRSIDPALELEVQDATDLPYADESFDNVICVSVIEHMGRGNDSAALRELLRVTKPGGSLHLSSMVSSEGRDVFVDHRIYGDASRKVGEGDIFFEHLYSPGEFAQMTDEAGWKTEKLEYAIQTRPQIQERFYRWVPFSYLVGPLLRLWFPRTIRVVAEADAVNELGSARSAVVNAKLIKTS